MKVHITNPGQPNWLTQVTNTETGEDLTKQMRISEITIRVKDDIPLAILTSRLPVIDIIADAEIRHVCPACGRPEQEQG